MRDIDDDEGDAEIDEVHDCSEDDKAEEDVDKNEDAGNDISIPQSQTVRQPMSLSEVEHKIKVQKQEMKYLQLKKKNLVSKAKK